VARDARRGDLAEYDLDIQKIRIQRVRKNRSIAQQSTLPRATPTIRSTSDSVDDLFSLTNTEFDTDSINKGIYKYHLNEINLRFRQ
jgi:hypothetical protein